jgi:hypothetical protein
MRGVRVKKDENERLGREMYEEGEKKREISRFIKF